MFKILPESQQAVITADRLGEINRQDENGKTFLMKLVEENDVHAAVAAIDYADADLTIKDNRGRTAYDYANELDCNPLFKQITKPKTPTLVPAKTCCEKFMSFIGLGR